MVEVEETSNDGEDLPSGPVVSADGLREVIMLPEWTVHKFNFVIKKKYFSTFRVKFQISDYIPIRQPYVSEKCY